MAITENNYTLVVVEDSDDDICLFHWALKRTGLNESFRLVRHFPNGDAVINYFTQVIQGNSEPLPDIVILDIKLPGRNGFDVLKWMQCLSQRPVTAMFSSSALAEDRLMADRLGADLFQTKTFDPVEFSRFLNCLGRMVCLHRGEKDLSAARQDRS